MGKTRLARELLRQANDRGCVVPTGHCLDSAVTGLALVGDRERCGALYPLTLDYIATGQVFGGLAIGPGSPQPVAAIAAHAAGHDDKAREHFEIAGRQALWHGRMLVDSADTADRARGRAMIEAVLHDFESLHMVTHVHLADRWLRTD